ncbi:FAD-dependent oxidoreductase [Rhodovibrionaceae bacterium A322]
MASLKGKIGQRQQQSRRQFIRTGLMTAAGTLSLPYISRSSRAAGAPLRVLVLGGGIAGASVARLLNSYAPSGAFEITLLVGRAGLYHPPFLQTAVQLGLSNPVAINLNLALSQEGILVDSSDVTALDPVKKQVTVLSDLGEGTLDYDLLVVATGIEQQWQDLEITQGDRLLSPCWTAEERCQSLVQTLRDLPDGGTLALLSPAQPYRCPPAFYERVCLMANILKKQGKEALLLVLDEKDDYPQQDLFEAAYADYYDGMIEWVPRDFHGGVVRIDGEAGLLESDFETFEADLIQAFPPQQAARFLQEAGLTDDSGYCPVSAPGLRSRQAQDIYVLGDAASTGALSKSASSAANQAELVVRDILLRSTGGDQGLAQPEISDRCWSFVAPDDAIFLNSRYGMEGDHFTLEAVDKSAVEDSQEVRADNAADAGAWPFHMIEKVYLG